MLRHLENEKVYQLRKMLKHRNNVMKKHSETIDKESVMKEIEQLKLELRKRREKCV